MSTYASFIFGLHDAWTAVKAKLNDLKEETLK